MRNFDYTKLENYKWDNEALSYIAKIHECKGRQDLFVRQKPIELDRLTEVAKIQSTEASNKIEGIVTTSTRIKQLVEEKTTPRNRDESEILGYRDVLNTIHESHDYIPITPSYILQLHRDLLKHAGLSYGGNFKNTQNY
ncbi:MAG: Fic family protein, partial [Roseburia sp.]|nr:Fic family protein [Roseburia sp.]